MGERFADRMGNVATRLFGPVFALEAARLGRRSSTFLIRWFYLFILSIVLLIFLYVTWEFEIRIAGRVVHPNVLSQFAENFFWVYAAAQYIFVAILTPALTAGSITDEKERKTL